MYYTPLPLNGFQLDAQESNRTYLFVTSIDSEQARAKRSFDYGRLRSVIRLRMPYRLNFIVRAPPIYITTELFIRNIIFEISVLIHF
jgi:hypothetical protein